MERALLRVKPFDGQGRGYRDYLVWESLRTEMYYAPEETVVLVTANTRDFCDGDVLRRESPGRPRPLSPSWPKVAVVASLEAFNDGVRPSEA